MYYINISIPSPIIDMIDVDYTNLGSRLDSSVIFFVIDEQSFPFSWRRNGFGNGQES